MTVLEDGNPDMETVTPPAAQLPLTGAKAHALALAKTIAIAILRNIVLL
jgi:hypothetical protein